MKIIPLLPAILSITLILFGLACAVLDLGTGEEGNPSDQESQ